MKTLFSFLEYCQTRFPGLFFLKNKMEKIQTFDQSHGLTPLEKSWFFDFLNFLFFIVLKRFLRSIIKSNTFFWLIIPKIQWWKIQFFYQTQGLTPLEKSWFFNFFNFLFFVILKCFVLSRIMSSTLILLADFAKNENIEKFQIFDENYGLTF